MKRLNSYMVELEQAFTTSRNLPVGKSRMNDLTAIYEKYATKIDDLESSRKADLAELMFSHCGDLSSEQINAYYDSKMKEVFVTTRLELQNWEIGR